MKVFLIAVGALVLAGGTADAQILKSPPLKNPQMLNVPDCPTGFVKTNVTTNGDARIYTCTTRPIQCPPGGAPVYGGMVPGTPAAKTAGTGPQESATFSYTCSYTTIN